MKNFKKYLISCFIIMIFGLSAIGSMETYDMNYCKNKPDNFRGIKWGVHINKLHDMILVEDDKDLKIYQKSNDKMSIGSAKLKNIIYKFYKNRFFAVQIQFEGPTNFSTLKSTFCQQYGKVDKFIFEEYQWDFNDVSISLEKSIFGEGIIKYEYKPIQKEQEKDEKEAERKGAADL